MEEKISRWWFQQRGAEASALLYHRRIFTLPNRAGMAFLATLATLLVASINYQLNLGYLLTFLSASMAWVGLHLSFGNLSGLRCHSARAEPVFCGEVAAFEFQIENTKKRARYAIRVSCGTSQSRFHVNPLENKTALLLVETTQRGWLDAPRATIDSLFPLGIWRVWSYWQPAARCLVYPAPENNPPPLPTDQQGHGEVEGDLAGSEHFAYVRPYQYGDSPRRIAWKMVARSDGEVLATKNFEGGASKKIWLDLNATGSPSLEQSLSRLTAWVLEAEERGMDYGLRLTQQHIAPSHGEAHRLQCLKALALC